MADKVSSDSILQVLETQIAPFRDQVIWVGLSGGMDSSVLLHAMVQLRSKQMFDLRALHVHHGLQLQADEWVEHCQQLCQAWSVPLEVGYVQVDSTKGVEAGARSARYAFFESVVSAHEVVCTAHHQRDQAETLLLNMLRGSGVEGLAAMPKQRRLSLNNQAWLLRPLRNVRFDLLQDYALKANLSWIEDPMNQTPDQKRNVIRHQILPVLNQAWSLANQKIAQAAEHCAEAADLLNALAQIDLAAIEHDAEKINWPQLQTLDWSRQKNILRFWFRQFHQVYLDNASLDWLKNECFSAGQQASPRRKVAKGEVRRYRNYLFYVVEKKEILDVELKGELHLSALGYTLVETTSDGLEPSWLKPPNVCRLRYLKADDQLNRDSLKKWFQQQHIPPWQRMQWPVIEVNGQLAAILNYRVMPAFKAKLNESALKFVGLN